MSAQTAETDIVRFLVGTQSLKFNNNQVHLVELNEETGSLKTQIFHHPVGEIWSLQASPTEPNIFITCYNALNGNYESNYFSFLDIKMINLNYTLKKYVLFR